MFNRQLDVSHAPFGKAPVALGLEIHRQILVELAQSVREKILAHGFVYDLNLR